MRNPKLMNTLATLALLAGTATVSFAAGAQTQEAAPAQASPAAAAVSGAAVVTDDSITASAKTALSADAQVAALPVTVTTRKGVVVVSGEVPSAAAGDRVLQIVAAVSGVKDVKNSLKVKAAS